jgi:chemotaxis protein histidine kinase CheA
MLVPIFHIGQAGATRRNTDRKIPMKIKTTINVVALVLFVCSAVAQTNPPVPATIIQSIAARETKLAGLEIQIREIDRKCNLLSEKIALEQAARKSSDSSKREMRALRDDQEALNKSAATLRLEIMEIKMRYKIPIASKKKR